MEESATGYSLKFIGMVYSNGKHLTDGVKPLYRLPCVFWWNNLLKLENHEKHVEAMKNDGVKIIKRWFFLDFLVSLLAFVEGFRIKITMNPNTILLTTNCQYLLIQSDNFTTKKPARAGINNGFYGFKFKT